MAIPLQEQCFKQGYSRRLAELATGVTRSKAASHTKAAINPLVGMRIPVPTDPLAYKQMAALGEQLYHDSIHSPDLLTGLKATLAPGFEQLKNMRAMHAAHMGHVESLMDKMKSFIPGSPEHDAVRSELARASSDFLHRQQQGFAEIGTIAHPRIQFAGMMKNLGLGAGAAGIGAGAYGFMKGRDQGQFDSEANMASMPLMERLKYLISPDIAGPPPDPAQKMASSLMRTAGQGLKSLLRMGKGVKPGLIREVEDIPGIAPGSSAALKNHLGDPSVNPGVPMSQAGPLSAPTQKSL